MILNPLNDEMKLISIEIWLFFWKQNKFFISGLNVWLGNLWENARGIWSNRVWDAVVGSKSRLHISKTCRIIKANKQFRWTTFVSSVQTKPENLQLFTVFHLNLLIWIKLWQSWVRLNKQGMERDFLRRGLLKQCQQWNNIRLTCISNLTTHTWLAHTEYSSFWLDEKKGMRRQKEAGNITKLYIFTLHK